MKGLAPTHRFQSRLGPGTVSEQSEESDYALAVVFQSRLGPGTVSELEAVRRIND